MSEPIDDDNAATRLRSLLTELWDGVRAHGLAAPPEGKCREGERLIHAYCGGIAKLRNELDTARETIAARDAEIAGLGRRVNELLSKADEDELRVATARSQAIAEALEEAAQFAERRSRQITNRHGSVAASSIAAGLRVLAESPYPAGAELHCEAHGYYDGRRPCPGCSTTGGDDGK